MYDFFGCADALVLDEGLDTFCVVNPKKENTEDKHDSNAYKYSNADFLEKLRQMSYQHFEKDAEIAKKVSHSYGQGNDMPQWPLNAELYRGLSPEATKKNRDDYSDIVSVEAQRSQVRAVLIFAVRQTLQATSASVDVQR